MANIKVHERERGYLLVELRFPAFIFYMRLRYVKVVYEKISNNMRFNFSKNTSVCFTLVKLSIKLFHGLAYPQVALHLDVGDKKCKFKRSTNTLVSLYESLQYTYIRYTYILYWSLFGCILHQSLQYTALTEKYV